MNIIFKIAVMTALAVEEPQPQAPNLLDEDDELLEIVVTGTRTELSRDESPVAVDVIDSETIRRSGAEDLGDVLQQQAGVQVTPGVTGAAITLQGLGPEQVVILVDGQRVVGRKNGHIDLSRYPVDAIERIEIIRGPASSLYGSEAMGGVVNLITRRSRPTWLGTVHSKGGLPRTLDASVGLSVPLSDEWSLRLDGGAHHSAAVQLDPTLAVTQVPELTQGNGSASTTFRRGNVTLQAQGSYALQDARAQDANASGAVFERRNVTEDATVLGSATVSTDTRTVVGRLGWTTTRDQYALDQQQATALDDYSDTREWLLQPGAQWTENAGDHSLTLGTEGVFEQMRGVRIDGGGASRQRLGVYAQDVWTLGRVQVTPGLRTDIDTQFGGALTPRLALRLALHTAWQLRLSAGTGYRAPSFRELYLAFSNPSAGYRVAGNPALRPEISRNVTTVLTGSPGIWRFELSGFYNDLEQLINTGTLEELPGQVVYGYVNVDRAWTSGGTTSLGLQSDGFGAGVDSTVTVTRDRSTGQPLQGRPLLQGAAHLTAATESGAQLTTRCRVTGARPFYFDSAAGLERTDAPAYALWDARGSIPAGPLTVFVGVENLLDAGDARFLPLQGRMVYGGFDATLGKGPES